jgi:hypothetical protein
VLVGGRAADVYGFLTLSALNAVWTLPARKVRGGSPIIPSG